MKNKVHKMHNSTTIVAIIIFIIVRVYYDKYSFKLYEPVQTATLICIKVTFGNQII